MPVSGIDHVALTVRDVATTCRFYERVLGAEPLYLAEFEKGDIPVALLALGGCRLSIHPASAPAAPHAAHPTPGSADLCFRWNGTIGEAAGALEVAGVEIIEGPVPRPACDGTSGASVYFRDPDDNLVELLTTD